MSKLAYYPLRGTIQKLKAQTNTTGAALEEYEDLYQNVPMYYETLRGKEFWEAKGLNSETVSRIRMRYISGITADMRIILNGRTLEIIPPIDNSFERNKELILTVKEVI